MQVITAKDANEAWIKAAELLQRDSLVKRRGSRLGPTNDLRGLVIEIEDPTCRWVVSRRPGINPAFALAEVVWILAGKQESYLPNFWNRQLPTYQGNGSVYEGAYGYRLRSHFGVDQLGRAYQALRNNPVTRQVVLQVWNPSVDLPKEDGEPAGQDIPCNICSILKIRDGKLDWMQVLRSNDLFLGLPYNLVQWTYLQEVLAGWLGIEVGRYTHIADSFHVYESNLTDIESYTRLRPKRNTDSLSMSKRDFDVIVPELYGRLDRMTRYDGQEKNFNHLVIWPDTGKAVENILRIVGADAARRFGWPDSAAEIMAGCSNPVFVQLWEHWLKRVT